MSTLQKITQLIAIASCMFIAGIATINAEEHGGNEAESKPPTHNSYGQMSNAMKKSMDPKVMTNMMQMMMQPEKMMTMESCAQCHDGEDIARYQKDFGPMIESMRPMMSMMNPMMGMMGPMMNPMIGMMGPMMNPMMGMMGPMMNPMMGMASPMMNPMMGMGSGMMAPMAGMGAPMMNAMMNPMGAMGMGAYGGQMMDPKQYEQMFNKWSEAMKNQAPQAQN